MGRARTNQDKCAFLQLRICALGASAPSRTDTWATLATLCPFSPATSISFVCQFRVGEGGREREGGGGVENCGIVGGNCSNLKSVPSVSSACSSPFLAEEHRFQKLEMNEVFIITTCLYSAALFSSFLF